MLDFIRDITSRAPSGGPSAARFTDTDMAHNSVSAGLRSQLGATIPVSAMAKLDGCTAWWEATLYISGLPPGVTVAKPGGTVRGDSSPSIGGGNGMAIITWRGKEEILPPDQEKVIPLSPPADLEFQVGEAAYQSFGQCCKPSGKQQTKLKVKCRDTKRLTWDYAYTCSKPADPTPSGGGDVPGGGRSPIPDPWDQPIPRDPCCGTWTLTITIESKEPQPGEDSGFGMTAGAKNSAVTFSEGKVIGPEDCYHQEEWPLPPPTTGTTNPMVIEFPGDEAVCHRHTSSGGL